MAGCFCCFDFLETKDCEGAGVNSQDKTRSWRGFSLVNGFRGQPNRFCREFYDDTCSKIRTVLRLLLQAPLL